ncbi:MAG: ATP synthase subunit D [Nitrospirales bacterium]|nr:MAG: ATP synthase subunit D [Nitrospirales bacterium]
MARLALNKTELHKQRQQLNIFQQFLPSLDLKRQHLMALIAASKDLIGEKKAQLANFITKSGELLPMVANQEIDLSGLLKVQDITLGEENILGVKLPVLLNVDWHFREYALLAKPHWVDVLVVQLRQVAELKIQIQVEEERRRRLDSATRRTAQRVNLFEKVMIPYTRHHIKKIQIFLADTERGNVVRSKIAKGKHLRKGYI